MIDNEKFVLLPQKRSDQDLRREKLAKLKERNSKNNVKQPEPKIRVLSCGFGVQSFTLAAMSAVGELPKLDLVVHADTTWERAETYKFIEKYVPFLEQSGIKVVTASSLSARTPQQNKTNINIPANFIGKKGPGHLNRQCTGRWKIDVVHQIIRQELEQRGLKKSKGIVEQWLGISWDEAHRAKSDKLQYINLRHPFLEQATRMTRSDCLKWLTKNGFDIPVKSACVHCVYHSQKNWQDMKRQNGIDWATAIQYDESIRNKSTKIGRQLYVHRSCKPLKDSVFLPEEIGYTQNDLIEGPGCDSAGYCWD